MKREAALTMRRISSGMAACSQSKEQVICHGEGNMLALPNMGSVQHSTINLRGCRGRGFFFLLFFLLRFALSEQQFILLSIIVVLGRECLQCGNNIFNVRNFCAYSAHESKSGRTCWKSSPGRTSYFKWQQETPYSKTFSGKFHHGTTCTPILD